MSTPNNSEVSHSKQATSVQWVSFQDLSGDLNRKGEGEGGGGENEHGGGGGKKPEVSFIAAYADIYIRLSFWQLSLM